jgi:hypothetical protein
MGCIPALTIIGIPISWKFTMAQIRGQRADTNDNNPVEVRHFGLIGTDLSEALGRFPTSPIWYRWIPGYGYIHWRYFPNGIIISTPETCAHVLYGPIYHRWDQLGQFEGRLGAPSSDILRLPGAMQAPGGPPPPPTPSYASFQHGVLYLDTEVGSAVAELSPLSRDMVTSATGILTTGPGIAVAAQATIQGVAAHTLATDQGLREHVESISSRVSFRSTGAGACSGAGFTAVGRSLVRSHILDVHFDFDLKGCAGTVGDADADLRVEVRLFVDPPRVTARLVNYWIDRVSSPFGAGDRDIRDGLSRALNGQFGGDLLNRTIPAGITVLAGIVEPNGDADLYISPLCSLNRLFESTGVAGTKTLTRLRAIRDEQLVERSDGRDFIEIVKVFGPALETALRRERDGEALRDALIRLLERGVSEEVDLCELSERIVTTQRGLNDLLRHPGLRGQPQWAERLTRRAVCYLREELHHNHSFKDVLTDVGRMIDEEIRRLRRDCAEDRQAD